TVRRGIRHDGQPLYPAMPVRSYVIARDAESKGAYDYADFERDGTSRHPSRWPAVVSGNASTLVRDCPRRRE
ncbi:hypothetical protein C7E12_22705, partial [Stenotrophomonas maltophilia]